MHRAIVKYLLILRSTKDKTVLDMFSGEEDFERLCAPLYKQTVLMITSIL